MRVGTKNPTQKSSIQITHKKPTVGKFFSVFVTHQHHGNETSPQIEDRV